MWGFAVCLACGVLAWLWTGGRGGARLSASETYREQLSDLRPELVRVVRGRYQSLGDLCEDAVDDGLVDLLQDEEDIREKVPTRERLFLYARRVVLNKAHDLAYKGPRTEEFPDGDPEALNPVAPDDTSRQSERRELSQHIDDALKRLPSMQAQAVRLFYIADLSCAEIARILGTSEKSVTRLLSNGRKALARLLADEQNSL